MAEPGYIYALINWSMPGLIKVGMTSRDTESRSTELSSATGVPTPFETVFHVLVPDAQVAESYIHQTLESRGYRVSEDREFFRAPIEEVVQLLISVRDAQGSIPLTLPTARRDIQNSAKEKIEITKLYEAAKLIINQNQGSISLLQRRMAISYHEAAKIMDELEAAGIVSAFDGSNPRTVLIKMSELDAHIHL